MKEKCNGTTLAQNSVESSALFGVTVKTDSLKLLRGIGIRRKHGVALLGQSGELTGRRGDGWQQVAFPGVLIGWSEPFVFCIPNDALTPNDQAQVQRAEY